MTSLTHDSISIRGSGVVTIAQPGRGARFTLDSLLLADFCRLRPRDRILEPGTGTGVISLLLAKKHPQVHITAVELQPVFADLCRKNIVDNGLHDRIVVMQDDINGLDHALKACSIDAIVANPPYTRSGAGKRSPSTDRLSARNDKDAPLCRWLDLHVFLKNKGRYFIVFPASRTAEAVSLMRQRALEPKRMRFVHPRANRPASLVLIESIKTAGVSLEVLPPLVVHESDDAYTDEMRRIYDLP